MRTAAVRRAEFVADWRGDGRAQIAPVFVRDARARGAPVGKRLSPLLAVDRVPWWPSTHQSHVLRVERSLRCHLDLRSGISPFAQPGPESVGGGDHLRLAPGVGPA